MGAALAAEEVIALTLLGGGAAALVWSFERAVKNCSCGPAPPTQNTQDKRTFDIDHQCRVSPSTLVSAVLFGTTVTNQKVPFKFSFLIGKGEGGGQDRVHAGILIEGDFDAEGKKYDFIFAERWNDCVRVNLFTCKSQALKYLRGINLNGVSLTDCNETPSFTSMTTADAMVEFIHHELPRELDVHSFKTLEDLQKMDKTNCIAFGMRAGMLLSQDEGQDFVKTCMSVIGS